MPRLGSGIVQLVIDSYLVNILFMFYSLQGFPKGVFSELGEGLCCGVSGSGVQTDAAIVRSVSAC